jgi:hypothetical protein
VPVDGCMKASEEWLTGACSSCLLLPISANERNAVVLRCGVYVVRGTYCPVYKVVHSACA